MSRSRTEKKDFRAIARKLGISESEAEKAVRSFFGTIQDYSRSLPFDNRKKIYAKESFDAYVQVFNIPYVGRIGPLYSRYLLWRKNESQMFLQEPRSAFRLRIPQSEIETMAADILSGRTPAPLKKRKGSELYERVWLVGKEGKKLARQVIPKNEEDV